MDLWSKGLGRRVLNMRLDERTEMVPEDGELVIRGTMGAPTYWDYTVQLDEDDVSEFLEFLSRPASVKYILNAKSRWAILGAALSGAVLFAMRALVALVIPPPAPADISPHASKAELSAKAFAAKRAAKAEAAKVDLEAIEAEVEANIESTIAEASADATAGRDA